MIKGNLLNIPNNLLTKFQANEIDEIMITGMGTCHTAAVAIAANMRNHPIIKQSQIKINRSASWQSSSSSIRAYCCDWKLQKGPG